MKKNIFRIFITSMVFVTIALPLRPNVCRAEKISDYDLIMKLEYSCYQGMITSVSSAGDYLVLSSQKRICLVDVSYKGSVFFTAILSGDNDLVDAARLKPGDWVLVWGGGLRGDAVAAKDIFLLSGRLSDGELKDFIQKRSLKSWHKEVFLIN